MCYRIKTTSEILLFIILYTPSRNQIYVIKIQGNAAFLGLTADKFWMNSKMLKNVVIEVTYSTLCLVYDVPNVSD